LIQLNYNFHLMFISCN